MIILERIINLYLKAPEKWPFVGSRYVVGIFFGISVWLFYNMCMYFGFSSSVTFLLTFTYSIIPAHILYSHIAKPHAFVLPFVMLFIFSLHKALLSGEKLLFIKSGMFAGISAASSAACGLLTVLPLLLIKTWRKKALFLVTAILTWFLLQPY